jgi:hypothetical protein
MDQNAHDGGKGLRNGEYGQKDGDRGRKVEQAQVV